MNFTICYLILIILCSSIVKSQDICQTPQNKTGSCIPVHNCKPVFDLIEQALQPLPDFVTNFLQKSFCGLRDNVHYVCCANDHVLQSATQLPTIQTDETMPTNLATPTNRNITHVAEETTPTTLATPTKPNITPVAEETIPSTLATPTNPNITPTNPNITPVAEETSSDLHKFGRIEDVSNHPNLNLLPTSCGLITDSRITTGTSMNGLPFMALLQYETSNGLEFRCGGTIINKRYILTAAHCVTGAGIKVLSVRVGEYNISTPKDCVTYFGADYCAPPAEDIEVEETRYHPDYNRPLFANDIAVIRLQQDINLTNANMKAICLPINNETLNQPLVNLLTAGWRLIDPEGASDVLLTARLSVVDQDTCQQQYGSFKVLESQFCAGGATQADNCQGDFGGPVFSPGKIHLAVRHIQHGIVAARHRICGGDDNFPVLYTRTANYMKWILDQLRE